MFSDHNETKLEINNKSIGEISKHLKLKNTLLHNPKVKGNWKIF